MRVVCDVNREVAMAQAYFMVRAVVGEADRAAFDRWYDVSHLPDAIRIFGAERAWRAWSRTDPSVHIAFYAFANIDAAMAILGSDGLKTLIADFDRTWGPRVTRSREVLEVAGEIEA
jgi:hypothetical protein